MLDLWSPIWVFSEFLIRPVFGIFGHPKNRIDSIVSKIAIRTHTHSQFYDSANF